METCKLCKQESELRLSHIIPKFVYRWMRETGPGRFRQMKNFNITIQDGIKTRMLCGDCEEKFSQCEKWFHQNIFNGYLNRNEKVFFYNPLLRYFAVSILWRVLAFFLDDGNNYKFTLELKKAEIEWRNYLLYNGDLEEFNRIHLIFIPEHLNIIGDLMNIYLYFQRSVDIEITESDTKSFVYAKFSRFLLIGEISGIHPKGLIKTNLFELKNITTGNQRLKDPDIIDFMINRASKMKSYDNMSARQKQQSEKYYKDKVEDIKRSDYWKVMKMK
jgi:hypothetical protein